MNKSIYHQISTAYDAEAASYDRKTGYGIPEHERSLWLKEILPFISHKENMKVLECGIGTGAFARIWLEQGHTVTGIDISTEMTQQIERHIPPPLMQHLHIINANAEQEDLFDPESFDLIVCRQFVCHLPDPCKVFNNWMTWLKDAGTLVVIEGMWVRSQWWDDNLVDRLPLSCTHSRATVAYLLSLVNFEIQANLWMDEINNFLDTSKHSKRYVIIARKKS